MLIAEGTFVAIVVVQTVPEAAGTAIVVGTFTGSMRFFGSGRVTVKGTRIVPHFAVFSALNSAKSRMMRFMSSDSSDLLKMMRPA